jgi:hypothetical protein
MKKTDISVQNRAVWWKSFLGVLGAYFALITRQIGAAINVSEGIDGWLLPAM